MTTEEAYAIFIRARSLNLSGWEILTAPNIERYCNGIGADWMPEAMRNTITHLNPTLRLAAAIHDIRYGIGGSNNNRKEADKEFLYNGKLLAKAEYKWYNPIRYYVSIQALRFYRILRVAGGVAWNAHE